MSAETVIPTVPLPTDTATRRGGVSVVGVSMRFTSRGGREHWPLRDLSLDIAPGEFVSIIGRSGCGKSTLLEIIAGLQTATVGEVRVDGELVRGPGADRTLVFQQYALFPWRTAVQNVMFPMEMARRTPLARLAGRRARATDRQRALELLELVGLAGAGDKYAGQLSGGMQQRVGLARALACQPRILLMDEPFSGADAITREALQEQLKIVHRQVRTTVVFVTHSVDEAMRLSDRIVVMSATQGRFNADVRRDYGGASGDAERRRADAADVRDQIGRLLRDGV
jgi:NitT/TauT family transport system ATP-binding protein